MSKNPAILVPTATVINLADRECVLAWENGGASKDPLMYGLDGFAASTNYYRDTANAGPFGSAPFTMITGTRVTTRHVTGNTATVFTRGNLSGSGGHWQGVRLGNFEAGVTDGAAAALSPNFAVTNGRSYVLCSTLDAAGGTLRFYRRTGEVGSGTSVTAYTAPGALGVSFGSRQATGTQEWNVSVQEGQVSFVGVIQGTALSAAQAQTWIDACEANRDIAAPPVASGTLYTWSVKRQNRGADLNPWTPLEGPDTSMTLTGTLNVESWDPVFD